MVFFTCNKCGDSLKKKDCADHTGKCYPLTVKCVDCRKDFLGKDFAAHTSCVTKAEKDGGKGIVSRAPSTKGATKQQQWTHAILSASKLTDLAPGPRLFLGIIKQYKNVPKKKKPFQNFARDVWKGSGRHLDILDEVFGIVESEFEKIKVLPKGNDSSEAKVEGNEGIKDKVVNNCTESVVETNRKSEGKKEVIKNDNGLLDEPLNALDDSTSAKIKTKNKKKHTNSDEAEEEAIMNGNMTSEEPAVNAEYDSSSAKSKTKKKKKHKKSAEAQEGAIINGNGTLEEPINAEYDSSSAKSKTKKKKKHKKSAEAEEVVKNANNASEAPVTAEDDPAYSVERKRKRQEKLAKVDDNGSIDNVDLPKKSKKTKHKRHEDNAVETVQNSNGQNETSAKEAAKKSKKKKLKLQDGEECVPRKKNKITIGYNL